MAGWFFAGRPHVLFFFVWGDIMATNVILLDETAWTRHLKLRVRGHAPYRNTRGFRASSVRSDAVKSCDKGCSLK